MVLFISIRFRTGDGVLTVAFVVIPFCENKEYKFQQIYHTCDSGIYNCELGYRIKSDRK